MKKKFRNNKAPNSKMLSTPGDPLNIATLNSPDAVGTESESSTSNTRAEEEVNCG